MVNHITQDGQPTMIADLKDGCHEGPIINECAWPAKHTEIERIEIRKTGNKSKPSTKPYGQEDSCPHSQRLGPWQYTHLMLHRLPAQGAFEQNDGEEHLVSEV